MVVRLPLAAAAPPACTRANRAGSLGEVGADRRAAREELEGVAGRFLPLFL